MKPITDYRGAAALLIAAASIIFISSVSLAAEYAFITTTDYTTGSSSVIRLDGSHTTDMDVASVHSDAVCRWYGGLIYVVNRGGADNIQILDPEDSFSTLDQFSVGNGSNPQDIAFISESKAYVTRYDSNQLWIVNPATGAHTGTVDLSSLADSDGLCEMDKMIIIGGTLFVSIQRMDRNNYWLPAGTSYIAAVDCGADTLIDTDGSSPGVQPITLNYTNPFSDIQFNRFDGTLLISSVGSWGINDGGIEVIDPEALAVTGTMLTESAAGGDINDFEIYSPNQGFAIVTNASFNNELISFDPQTGLRENTLYSPGAYVINDIEISPGGELFLADQTETDPGIRIYSCCDGSQITSSPINTGLPPFDICFSGAVQTDSEDPAPTATLGHNYPNPFNPSTSIDFSISAAVRVKAAVYDATGRKVKTLSDRIFRAGLHTIRWDGRDSRSRPCHSGIYFARFYTGDFTGTVKMVLIR